jgi:hypothetical protein
MLWVLALLFFLAPAAPAQTAATATTLTLDQQEEFLAKAEIKKDSPAKKGITNTVRATLSDGTITHDASIQTIDERKPRFDGPMGPVYNFRDTYKFNIAASRLAGLLGLRSMVPLSIERKYKGNPASFTWWVDDVLGDEGARLSKKITPPDSDSYARQLHIQRVFDQLIYNWDRNQGNTLFDKSWHLWMIDHTRAFSMLKTLQDEKVLQRCDSQLLAKLKQLDEKTLTAELGKWLEKGEIQGLLGRRDRIVARFEKLGPKSLYDWLPAR